MSTALKSIKASFFLVAEALTNRLIGIVSTLILARVLVPADFGIVAIAVLLLGFVEVLGNTAGVQYLLKIDNLTDEHVNTHFTLNLIIQLALGLLFLISAPLAAYYYNDMRLEPILQVLFINLVVRALMNPAEVYLRREHTYSKIVKVSMITKVFSASTAVSTALLFQSYWALILGHLVGTIGVTVGSYIINPYKPRFTLKYVKEQWSFSAWMIPQSVLGYTRTQLDTFIVSTSFGRDALGSYHVMKFLSYIPLASIITPATQPLLVELSQVKHDRRYFSKQFNISLLGIMFLVIPISTVMLCFDKLIVSVLLGQQWVEYAYLLSVLGFLLPATAMVQQANRVLLVYGKTKYLFYYELASFFILYSILLYVGFKDLFVFTLWRVSLENILTFSYMSYIALKYTNLSSYIKILGSIVIVTVLSVISASIAKNFLAGKSEIINLLSVSTIYALTFLLLVTIAYFSFGKFIPEWKYIYEILKNRAKR